MGHGGHTHRGTGVARVGLGGGINLATALVKLNLRYDCRIAAHPRSHWGGYPSQWHQRPVRQERGIETGRTYRENADGVDRQLVQISVTHDGRF